MEEKNTITDAKTENPTTSWSICATSTWNANFTKRVHIISPIHYIFGIAEKTKAHTTILKDE